MTSSPAPALDRGLQLIATIAAAGSHGCSFGELARSLGVANTIASRLLSVLQAHGWAAKGDDGRYRLGTTANHISQPHDHAAILTAAADPVLRELAGETSATALLVVRAGDGLLHAAKHQHPSGHAMRDIGSRRVTWLTHPWGWAIAAGLTATERQRLLADEGAGDIPSAARRSLREHGWCCLDQDTGQRLAAPITDPAGTPIAALALGGTLPKTRRADAGRRLVLATKALATALTSTPMSLKPAI